MGQIMMDENNGDFSLQCSLKTDLGQHTDHSRIRSHKIQEALDMTKDPESNLIGDFSRKYSLPTVQGQHSDLASISPTTLSQLLRHGEKSNVTVVDCRYPYEYAGGHINGAKNLFTKEMVMQELLGGIEPLSGATKTNRIIVFHCEFSVERGPKMLRFLREQDRALNEEVYPALHYPEIYLLEGGYKEFWNFNNSTDTPLCQPNAYIQMLDDEFEDQLTYYTGFNEKSAIKRDAKKFGKKRSKNLKCKVSSQKEESDMPRRSLRKSLF